MKKLLAFVFLAMFLGTFISAQDEDYRRGFYVDVGAGWGWIKYPEPFNSSVKSVADLPGVTRISIDIDLSLGYAVIPNLYIVGSLGGIADSLSASNTLTMMTMFIGPGVKFYPLPSKKYLQLGLDIGYSGFSISDSRSSDSIKGPTGFAFQLSVVGDFDKTMTGPALLLGGKFYLGILDGEVVPAFSLFAKFVYKAKKRNG